MNVPAAIVRGTVHRTLMDESSTVPLQGAFPMITATSVFETSKAGSEAKTNVTVVPTRVALNTGVLAVDDTKFEAE